MVHGNYARKAALANEALKEAQERAREWRDVAEKRRDVVLAMHTRTSTCLLGAINAGAQLDVAGIEPIALCDDPTSAGSDILLQEMTAMVSVLDIWFTRIITQNRALETLLDDLETTVAGGLVVAPSTDHVLRATGQQAESFTRVRPAMSTSVVARQLTTDSGSHDVNDDDDDNTVVETRPPSMIV